MGAKTRGRVARKKYIFLYHVNPRCRGSRYEKVRTRDPKQKIKLRTNALFGRKPVQWDHVHKCSLFLKMFLRVPNRDQERVSQKNYVRSVERGSATGICFDITKEVSSKVWKETSLSPCLSPSHSVSFCL